MTDATWIAVITAFAAVLKGKDFWNYLTHKKTSKKKDKEILELRKRLKSLEASNNRYKKLLK